MKHHDSDDILEQPYKGPNKEVVAVGLGAIEGKVAFLISPFVGATVGYLGRDTIENFLAKSEKANHFIEANVGLLGKDITSWMAKYPGNKAMMAGAVGGMFIIPTIAAFHGMYKGYASADSGKKQFDTAKDEIRELREQLITAKAETATWQKRIEAEIEARETNKDKAPEVGA